MPTLSTKKVLTNNKKYDILYIEKRKEVENYVWSKERNKRGKRFDRFDSKEYRERKIQEEMEKLRK